MILAIYNYRGTRDYSGMYVVDLEKSEKIPGEFIFDKRAFFGDGSFTFIPEVTGKFFKRNVMRGDRLAFSRRDVVESIKVPPVQLLEIDEMSYEEATFRVVRRFTEPILDYLENVFIKRFHENDYWFPPEDLSDRSKWGIYADWLMDHPDSYAIGEAINKIVDHPMYNMSMEDLVVKRGAFKCPVISTRKFNPESYTPEALEPYGGELLGKERMIRGRQIMLIPQIKFPNLFRYEEWLQAKVVKSTELPKMEDRYLLHKKEAQWKDAKRRKEVGW